MTKVVRAALLAALLMLGSGPAWAGATHVQEKPAVACCAQVSISVTTTSNVTAGNALALFIYTDDTSVTISSVSGASCQSNTFIDSTQNPKGTGTQGQAWGYYAKNITGGACTITVTVSGSVLLLRLIVHEIGGVDSNPFDKSDKGFQSSPGTGANAVTTGAQTTTTNGQYIFAAMASSGNSDPAAGTNFTARADCGVGAASCSESWIQPSAGSVAGTFTQGIEGNLIASVMMTFKAAGTSSGARIIGGGIIGPGSIN